MANSNLVDVTILSPNNSGKRNHVIDRITPHVVVGQCTAEALGNLFADPNREASCNYGIDKDGRVLLCVDENNRSWCSSSSLNDNRAITFECASDTFEPYRVNNVVFDKLVYMCIDICRRYNKTKLIWIDDKQKALSYNPKGNEMIITVHRWFANKSCPGDYLYGRLGELAKTVTKQLSIDVVYHTGKYKLNKNLKLRVKPSTTSKAKRTLAKGSVVEISKVRGHWGFVERFQAWICLKYCSYQQYKLGTYILNKDLWLRQSASSKGKKIKKLKKGTTIYVTQKQNSNWGYNDKINNQGWVCLKYCYYTD